MRRVKCKKKLVSRAWVNIDWFSDLIFLESHLLNFTELIWIHFCKSFTSDQTAALRNLVSLQVKCFTLICRNQKLPSKGPTGLFTHTCFKCSQFGTCFTVVCVKDNSGRTILINLSSGMKCTFTSVLIDFSPALNWFSQINKPAS